MPAFFFVALGLLACLSSIASAFKIIQFSNIEQCGPFNISFSVGKLPESLPLTLTVLPFDSAPISITIPSPSWDASTLTGAAITFLPLAAGTTFIASLDDANGRGVGPVSDIIRIQPSNDDSCTTPANPLTQQYTVSSALSQCQPFQVTYNLTAHPSAPTVRAFIPRGPSYYLNQTENAKYATVPPFEIASYEMTALRGVQILMLFEDKLGYRESSNLTTVLGDVSSSKGCLAFFTNKSAGASSELSSTSSGPPKKTIVAVAATIGSVVITVAILMGIYAYRHRRRDTWKEMKGIEGGPGIEHPRGLGSIPPTPEPKLPTNGPSDSPYLSNPPYPVEKFTTSPLSPNFLQSPPDGDHPQYASYVVQDGFVGDRPSFITIKPPSRNSAPAARQSTRKSGQRDSTTSSVDIDQILDLAKMYSPAFSPRGDKPLTPESPHTPYSPYSNIVVTPAANTPERPRQRGSFPVSPMPSVSNFGDSHESHLQAIATEVARERSWNEVRPARKSSGVYSPGLAFPEAVVTRHDRFPGVGRGRGHS